MKRKWLALILAALTLAGCAGAPQPTEPTEGRTPVRIPIENTDPTAAPRPTEPTEPTEPADPDGDYYLTSQYADVRVDAAKNVITLGKKLSVQEFTKSFLVKINYVFKVIDSKTDEEIADKAEIVTSDMICRVFTQGEPVADIAIQTSYDPVRPPIPAGEKDTVAPGTVSFYNLGGELMGTGSVTKDGAVLDAGARTPSITAMLPEPLPITEKGNFVLTLQNTSNAKTLTVEFVTQEDSVFTNFKSFRFPLKKTAAFQEQTLDVSDCYGWLGHLTGVRISADGLTEGSIVLKYMTVREGGSHYIQGLHFDEPTVYMDADTRIEKIDFIGPDGILGCWKDENGGLRFLGSAQTDGVSGFFVTSGTADDPFRTILHNDKLVSGVDWEELQYCSIAQVVREPTTGMLIGITHLERHYNDGAVYVGTLGLSTSTDNGATWNFLGEFISHDRVPDGNAPTVSRDIGNGTILMDENYLYIFCIDYRESDLKGGFSVARVALGDLYAKTLAGELPAAYKYCDGRWEEPGWGGAFTNVLPEDIAPNFMYITHNTVLDKYLMVICQSPYYQSNDGDLLLLASDSLLDWSNAQRQWIATGKHGEQYPTVVSVAEDPQLESGETFYIYWCGWDAHQEGLAPWEALWSSARYMRCKVTVTK